MLNNNHFVARSIKWQTIMLGIIGLLIASFAMAQAAAPTAQEIQAFQGLDPATQQTVLQNLGQGTGTRTTSDSSASSQNQNNAASERRRRQSATDKSGTQQMEPQVLSLQAEDTVLVSIDFPRAKTTVVPGTNGQAAQIVTIPLPTPDKPLTDLENKKLQDLITLIRSKNPYKLTRNGELLLPGFMAMPLGGLSVDQATARLSAEPAFLQLQVSLSLLPLEKSGIDALKPFGYDLFNNDASTFAPVTDVPVPADYVVGAGDTLSVQLYGNQNRSFKLIVGRDGLVSFPELGPINVSGQTFTAVQSGLEDRVSRQMIGVHASISMGETRSIRVFVLGEANLPGSYTVSGLSTMTTALFASGGVKPIGSLRNIQLKRQGAIIRTLDLYDMLLNGDTSNDAKLLPGDVIFIPTVSATVSVDGEVRRPAIYELKENASVKDVIKLAGGLTADADASQVYLTHIGDDGRNVVNVNLEAAASASVAVRNGDSINVVRVPPTLDSGVSVAGYLYAPRVTGWHQGLRISDVINSVDQLKPNADIHYLLIRRELSPDRRVTVLSVDLAKALANRGSDADVLLMPRDRITVFDFETNRTQVIKPILDELQLQSKVTQPTEIVSVNGRIKVPGDYPLEPNMHVSDLLRAGGNLQDAAYASSAELIRYVDQNGKRVTQLLNVDLNAIANGDKGADLTLQSADVLTIKELPQWADQETITLQGEVKFPGVYAIERGETLSSVIARAGGLTDLAFSAGSVFTRKDLQEREQEQLDTLADRMQRDLTTMALQGSQFAGAQGAQSAQSLSIGESLLAQLKRTKAVGRLVIDLNKVVSGRPGNDNDVILRDGDMLLIPKQRQEVTVIGEVQTATSLLYHQGMSRDDYIAQGGGLTRRADKKQIYVVRANGSVIADTSHRWFSGGASRVEPGDTIVVPLDTEHMPALPLWQAVTQIMYNIAIAAAAVHSF